MNIDITSVLAAVVTVALLVSVYALIISERVAP